jgi:hypothetical protein
VLFSQATPDNLKIFFSNSFFFASFIVIIVLKCFEDGATPEEVFEWYPGASLEVLRRIRSIFRPGVAVSH